VLALSIVQNGIGDAYDVSVPPCCGLKATYEVIGVRGTPRLFPSHTYASIGPCCRFWLASLGRGLGQPPQKGLLEVLPVHEFRPKIIEVLAILGMISLGQCSLSALSNLIDLDIHYTYHSCHQ
jgi:hypothetical protein